MFSFPAIHGEVIQEYLHECRDELAKYFHDYSLECRRRCLESEHHDHYYKDPPFGDERRLFLVVGMHPYLIVLQSHETLLGHNRDLGQNDTENGK